MNKSKKIVAIFILITIIIIGYGAILFTHNSPEAAIRRHLFRYNPRQSLSCHITKTNIVEKVYGQQYTVKGFTDSETGNLTCFAYVKKNSLGLYYCSAAGSGP
jgi:hypothetical protein